MALPASGQISFSNLNFERGLGNAYTLDMAHAAYVYNVDTAGGISMDEFYSKQDIFFTYGGCGYGNSSQQACDDATYNSRTLYSATGPFDFGVGSNVYTNKYPTPLVYYTNLFMNDSNWIINAGGLVTAVNFYVC